MTGEESSFESLAELIGQEGALNLCEQYGGQTLYIRKSMGLGDGLQRHWAQHFGADAYERIQVRLGGKRVYIPAAPPELLDVRNATIIARMKNGESTADIAHDFKLTGRGVISIFNRRNTDTQGESK